MVMESGTGELLEDDIVVLAWDLQQQQIHNEFVAVCSGLWSPTSCC